MSPTSVTEPDSPVAGQTFSEWNTGGTALNSLVKIANRLNTSFYDVTDPAYGATGDGVTDDTTAVQAAIDAANGSAPVWFPAGTYALTAEITLPSGTKIVGAGTALSILSYTGLTSAERYMANELADGTETDYLIQGVYIKGDTDGTPSGSGSFSAGLRFQRCTRVEIIGCRVSNVTGVAIALQGVQTGAILNNHIHDTGRDGVFTTSYTDASQDIVIANNRITENGDDGIAVHTSPSDAVGSPRATRVVVSGNTIVNHAATDPDLAGRGVIVSGAEQVSIVNNAVFSTYGDGIVIGKDDNPPSLGDATFDVTGGASEDLWTLTTHGLSVGDPVQFSAVGTGAEPYEVSTTYWAVAVPDANTFQLSATKGGAVLEGTGTDSVGTWTIERQIMARDISVVGNTIRNAGQVGDGGQPENGIRVIQDTKNFIIANNTIVNSKDDGVVLSVCTNGIVSGNMIRDSGIMGIDIGTAEDIQVTNNVCVTNTGNGIRAWTGTDRANISNNICTDNGDGVDETDSGIQISTTGVVTVSGNTCIDTGVATQTHGIWCGSSGIITLGDDNYAAGNVTDQIRPGTTTRFRHRFFDADPVAQPTVSGARDTPEAALADLLTELETLGLIIDSTTAT